MALTLADAVVYFSGDDSQLKRDTEGAKGGLTKFAGSATKLVGGAVVAAAALAGAAILKIGVAAFDVSQQTDAAAAAMGASLGIPKEEAEKFAEVARRVYGENFAESITQAAEVVAELNRQLGITNETELQSLTEQAFALNDVFGTDMSESISTVKTLMENFGLSSQEAFDFLTTGYQKGLDRSGDFSDSINEYGPQFRAAGFDAGEFFSIMETGSEGGTLGTDKISDAIKEMVLRLNEGGDDVADVFTNMGYDFDQVTAGVRDGEYAWSEYFPNIIAGLNDIEDPIERSQAQVAIFGTMAEDLGTSFTEGLSSATTSLDQMSGATETLNTRYETFGDFMSAMWRKTIVAAAPLTDLLLDMAERAMPTIERAFEAISAFIENRLVPALDGTTDSFAGIKAWIDQYMPGIRDTVTSILEQMATFWDNHGATIMHVVQNTFEVISTVIGTTLSVITGVIQLFLQLMNGDFQGAGQTLNNIVQNLLSGLDQIFRIQLDSIRAVIGDFGGSMLGAGQALIDNLWEGIRRSFDNLIRRARDKMRELRNLLPGSEPKDTSSPLYGLRDAGRGLVTQMQRGIDDVNLNINGATNGFGIPAAVGASAGNAVSITVNVNGGGTEVGQQTRRGVLDALREAGLR